jgi:hypothetical protein
MITTTICTESQPQLDLHVAAMLSLLSIKSGAMIDGPELLSQAAALYMHFQGSFCESRKHRHRARRFHPTVG